MRALRLAPLGLVLLAGCLSLSDGDDHASKEKHSQAEERAEKYCVQAVKSRGLRVDDVVRIEKLGKQVYSVKLRVEQKSKDEKDEDKDFVLYCRYDDETRDARID